METVRRKVFFDERDFDREWSNSSAPTPAPGGPKRKTRPSSEILSEAAHFLGGALLSDGFTLFHNGGLPLIERRTGPLIQEILMRRNPTFVSGSVVPIRLNLHLNHSGLQSTRMRYWGSPTRAPSSVAGIDIGQLELPPCWVIWNLGTDHQTLVELVDWVRELALPWFEIFEDELVLRRKLFRGEVPKIGLDTALELVLAEFGELEGARFMRECILCDSTIGPKVREMALDISRAKAVGRMGKSIVNNLATIAASHRLIRR